MGLLSVNLTSMYSVSGSNFQKFALKNKEYLFKSINHKCGIIFLRKHLDSSGRIRRVVKKLAIYIQ